MLYRSSKSVQVQREHYAEPLAKQACRGCEPRGLQATCRCSRWSRSQDRPLPPPSTPQSSFRQLRTGQVPTMSATTEQRWWWRRYTYAASPRLAAYRWPSCFLCFLPREDIQPSRSWHLPWLLPASAPIMQPSEERSPKQTSKACRKQSSISAQLIVHWASHGC